MPIITLLTDFGTKDPYVAEMKAVILSICPSAPIVDITHEISSFNILEAALVLAEASQYFPSATIHVVVVDPGVGSERRAIAVKTKHFFFVGPDNGVLSLAIKRDGGARLAVSLENPKYFLGRVSRTFHGRDIFAPVAAHIANGIPLQSFGPPIGKFIELSISEPDQIGGAYGAEVLFTDKFGNCITNIGEHLIPSNAELVHLELEDGRVIELPLVPSYASVPKGVPLAIVDSFGLLEIAVNMDSAERLFSLKAGKKVKVSFKKH